MTTPKIKKPKFFIFAISKEVDGPIEWIGRSVSGISRPSGLWTLALNNKCKPEFNKWAQSLDKRFSYRILTSFANKDSLLAEYAKMKSNYPVVEGDGRVQNVLRVRHRAYLRIRTRLLEFIEQNPNASNVEISAIVGIRQDSIKRSVQSLQKIGLLTWYNGPYGNSVQESSQRLKAAPRQGTEARELGSGHTQDLF